jgi:release factor glutamine methyltransferase
MPPERLDVLLRHAQEQLAAAGIETARLDARLLLQAAAGLRYEAIIADPAQTVSDAVCRRFATLLERRRRREPVARILGEREFFGRRLQLTPATLDPRPDTETLVEEALRLLPAGRPATVLDLGTGTGAIVIALLGERPLASGVATDLAPEALAVARANAERHGVLARLALVQADWYEGIGGRFDLIVSNPPYIRDGDIATLTPEVREHDPRAALAGGADGLDAYRDIAAGARRHLQPGGHVAVEIGAGQAPDVAVLFRSQGLGCVARRADLAGHIRVLTFAQM